MRHLGALVDRWSVKQACVAPCFLQVVLASEVTPPQTTGWKVTVAGILFLLLLASSVQLSLVANITKLPKVGDI